MDDATMIYLYNKGYRSRMLSTYFDLPQKEILVHMRRLGLDNHRKNLNKYKDEIIDRYINGESVLKICKDYGVGMRSIYVYLKEWGVKPLWGHRYRDKVLPSLKALGRRQFKELYAILGMKGFLEFGYGTIDINIALWYYGLRAKPKRARNVHKIGRKKVFGRHVLHNPDRHSGSISD